MSIETAKNRPRVLSGMRPTGKLHLGNYVGALQNWVKLQHTHKCFFFVADWHALTTDYEDTSRVADHTLEVLLDWLGAGLDPKQCTMFVQSHIKQHAELHVLFSMVTPLGWLERVPTYKEQQQNLATKDLSTYGFLGYPLLQAADILIYQADFVPVGEDQVAHVELTREVARRFNQIFDRRPAENAQPVIGGRQQPLIKEPQVLLTKTPKLLGMDGRKMSKSYGNSILLSEEPAQLAEKINNSVTDRPKLTDKGNPDRCPVGNLHQIFSDADRLAFITKGCTQAGIKCVECKALAIESTEAHLKPIRERRKQFAAQPDLLRKIVQEGDQQAYDAAEETMRAVRDAVGLLDPATIGRSASETIADPRQMWIDIASRSYRLRDIGHKTFVTAHNRRIGVPTVTQLGPDSWQFEIPDRHFDAIAIVCFDDDGDRFKFHDFVIPMKSLTGWSSFTREGKIVKFRVLRSGERFLLQPESATPQDITDFLDNSSPLE